MHCDDFSPPSIILLETSDAFAPGSTYSGVCVLGWSTHLPNGLAMNERVSNFYLLCDEFTQEAWAPFVLWYYFSTFASLVSVHALRCDPFYHRITVALACRRQEIRSD